MWRSFYADHGRKLLWIFAISCPWVVYAAWAAALSNTNDVRTWLPEDYEETRQYSWFTDRFGSEEFILTTWPGCTVGDPKLEEVAERIVALDRAAAPAADRVLASEVLTGSRSVTSLERRLPELSREEALERFRGTLVGLKEDQSGVVVAPTAAGKERLHELVALIEEAARQSGVAPTELRLGGPPIVNAAIDDEGARSLTRFVSISGFITLLVCWRCFRSVRLTVMVVTIGAFCAALSMAVLWATGREMNAILLMMPQLVYVAAMSGAIHLVNYYLEALEESGAAEAPQRAVAHALLPLALAGSTTAIGLLSLTYSELPPIQQFGVYSAAGVALGTLALVLFLPAALQMFPSAAPTHRAGLTEQHDSGLLTMSRRATGWARQVIRWKNLAAVLCLGAMLAGALALPRLRTSIRVEKFFDARSKILQDYDWIESRFGGLVPVEVVLRIPDDAKLRTITQLLLVEKVEELIGTLPFVTSTHSAAAYCPEMDGRSNVYLMGLNRRLERARSELEDTGYVRRGENETLWRVSLRIPTSVDVDYSDCVAAVRGRVRQPLSELRHAGDKPIVDVYTGMVPVFNKAQRSLMDGMLFGFGTDVVLIVTSVVVLLRHWAFGAVVLLASLFPTVIVLGIMSWRGIAVDIGVAMTPSVAIGVTVDDVVHFLLWFRRGIARGLSRGDAVLLAYQGCAKPMYQSWAIIGLGLSVFALSTFVPSQRFGVSMVALLTAGLAGNLLLMPALLAGPLGRIIASRIIKGAAESGAPVESTHEPSAICGPAH